MLYHQRIIIIKKYIISPDHLHILEINVDLVLIPVEHLFLFPANLSFYLEVRHIAAYKSNTF